MVNIPVQKWRVEGEKELYSTVKEAMEGQKPGTIIEKLIVIEEVPDPEDTPKSKRGETESGGGGK